MAMVGSSRCGERGDKDMIRPAPTLLETTPWNLGELSKAPESEWLDRESKIRSLLYRGEPFEGKPTRVFAYYATPGTLAGDPTKDRNLPGVVLLHGGGGRAFPQWVEIWAKRGYAALAMDLAGCGGDGERLPDGGPDQSDETKFGRIDAPVADQWPYHAVANAIRAHSLIRKFEEVDADRTALIGISWGGYAVCIVAGLDDRFKAAVPVYGCGFLNENGAWVETFAKMKPEQAQKWFRLWDPSRYLGSTTVPMLFVTGATEWIYTYDIHTKTCRLVKGERNLSVTPYLDHGHYFEGWRTPPMEIEIFVNERLQGGAPLPKFTSCALDGGLVRAVVETKIQLIDAQMHYWVNAKNRRHPEHREPEEKMRAAETDWESRPARIDGNRIVADAPPPDWASWFLTVQDERGAIVSSELALKEDLSNERVGKTRSP